MANPFILRIIHHDFLFLQQGIRMIILLDMFNRKNRSFYQSAIIYPLRSLPHKELVSFLVKGFSSCGKNCPEQLAEEISEKVSQFRTQIALLESLIVEYVPKTLLIDYMMHHRLSVGGIQYARNKLEKLDLIEKYDNV